MGERQGATTGENLNDADIDLLSLEDLPRGKKRHGPPRSDYALANAVLDRLITPDMQEKLEGEVAVSLVVNVPDRDWLIALHRALKQRFPRLHGKLYIEPSRSARYT